MCELFAVSALKPLKLNTYLSEFFSHSVDHPNGWGIALFTDNFVNIEKEPVIALESDYLKRRLSAPIISKNMMAHIRQATIGKDEYLNCHPFFREDNFGRKWTLMHNGTIFDGAILDEYKSIQEGKTDSERILCHLIRLVNQKQSELKRALSEEERFNLLDKMILQLAPSNKLNIMIYDGEVMYCHYNMKGKLHIKADEMSVILSTEPLKGENISDGTTDDWKEVPFMQLLAFKNGKLLKQGTTHDFEYIDNPENYRNLED